MRAINIMMFLLLFNLSISIVGALNIYPSYTSVGPDYDVSSANAGDAALSRFFGSIIVASIGGIIAGSIIAYLTKLPAASVLAYTIMTGDFWVITSNAFQVLWQIGGENTGMFVVLIVLGIITGFSFLAGIMQMITGGWRALE